MTTQRKRYIPFKDVPKGATFGEHWEWVKQSARTARHASAGRIFYFRQDDIVCLWEVNKEGALL